ncbi:hypothetical protein [Streptomyces lavendofoliae]|uniref:Uncharacterized protein n=1 Tax=Streptomyces lavendofoliae TaxID=67314 RepID=A0A918HZN5_9ACTN|nr:hypothetical protein [Streptomyces lavendofoliae]GGU44419.1 hypothetical protein GCM10010274_35670 [Streptomyces lavendofoliae]
MRAQIRVTRDGETFVVRLAPSQTAAIANALETLRNQDLGDEALALRVGAGRAEVEELIGRLRELRAAPGDLRLALHQLHVIHGALTAVATTFLVKSRHFSEEPFHNALGVFREDVDALAAHLAQAVSEAARP